MLKRIIFVVILAIAMSALTVTALANQMSPTQYVYLDDNGTVTRHATNADNVERFLRYVEVKLDDRDIVDPPVETEIVTGMVITINRCKEVTIKLNNVNIKTYSVKKTVGELLEENKDVICAEYVIEGMDASTQVTDGMVIKLTTGEVIKYSKIEKINYPINYIDDNSLYMGIEVVEVPGVAGEVEVVYKEVYVDNVLTAVEEISRTPISEPVSAVVRRGTIDNIDGIKFKKAMKMVVTGYTPWDEGCTGITASGKVANFGMIAADTKILPFGTRIYVPGYGIGVVEDRGGAIKGNRLDLCYMSLAEAFKWGVRDITVYILE